MADTNINININDTSGKSGGRITRTSGSDPKNIQGLTNALKNVNSKTVKDIAASNEKLVEGLLRSVAKVQGLKATDLDRIVQSAAREVTANAVKQIVRNLPKNNSGASTSDVSKSIERGMARHSKQLSQTLTNVFNKLEIEVDTSSLEKGLNSITRQAVPKNMDSAIRELNSAAGSIKNMSKDISRLVNSIKQTRASGGKVSADEISSVLTNLKQVANSFKELTADSKKAKSALAELAGESKQLKKDLTEAINNVHETAKSQATGAKTRAKDDPKKFTKEIVSGLAEVIKKTDTAKDSKLASTISKMQGNKADLNKISKEISDLRQDILKSVRSGGGVKEGSISVLRDLDKYMTRLGNLPKELGGSIALEIKALLNDEEIRKQLPKEYRLPVVLDPDSKKLDKVLPDKKTVKVDFDPDTDKLDKVIKPKEEVKVTYVPEGVDQVSKVISAIRDEAAKKKIGLGIISEVEVALNKNDLESARKGITKLTKLKLDNSALAEELRKYINVLEGQSEIKIKATLDTRSAEKARLDALKVQDTLQMESRSRKMGLKIDPTAFPMYRKQTVQPVKGGDVKRGSTIKVLSQEAQDIRRATEQNIKALSASLYKLQDQVVTGLEKQFKESEKKWAVVKPKGGTARDAFKTTPGGRQWTMQIANLDRLQRIMQDFDSGVSDLVKSYKSQAVQERVSLTGGPQKQADLVGQWLKSVSDVQIKSVEGLDDVIKKELSNIKTSFKGTDVSDEMRAQIRKSFGDIKLESVFRKTYAESEAKREMQQEGLVKQVALPAARVTKTGDVSFQTIHGSERALPKFAKFETGFERLYKDLTSLAPGRDKDVRTQILSEARGFTNAIKKVGVRPGPQELPEAEDLASKMISSIVKYSGDKAAGSKYVRELYTQAAKSKKFAVAESGGDPVKFMKNFEAAMAKDYKGLDDFSAAMKAVNVSAYDVAKSLNKIEVSNVYDIMGQVLKGSKDLSPIKTLGEQPQYGRSIRNFEKAVGEIEGMMPLLEQNRPRRGYHQENVVNLLSRTAPFYSAKDRLDPDAQKKLIKDLNLEVNETLKRVKQMDPTKLPGNLQRATSLGIPESQAGAVEEYRPGGTGHTRYLKNLQATSLKFYGQDLTTQAPFQQFQQAGRNISNVTNAMVDLAGQAELPKLRSTKERALIESERYGKRGYGYNVTAELRNTAANFEDQIVIAGKLAKALTSAVSTLVKPSQTGRVRGGSSEERIASTGVTELKEKEITKVARQYMEILGVPEEYKGRADKALIDEVRKTVSVIRGESVEVQQGKLTETFLNYFGRKLTTRYGSKGVSVTPTGNVDNLSEILSQYSGAKIKLDPSQTLGAAIAPKTMGKLASELFGDKVSQELKDRLIASGNKFIIDIFQKTGDGAVVAVDEAKKTAQLFKDFTAAWKDVMGGTSPGLGTSGIAQIQDSYRKQFGEKGLKEVKPIDVRISSYGAAKRGLQTEFLESIFSNVAGTGQGGVTTVKKLGQPAYEDLLKRGGLSKYSKALGYVGADKTASEIAPELYKKMGGKGTYEDALGSKDLKIKEKALLAKRAAAIEAQSSYYSTVIDEFGKKRKGLVGEKFLQIIEEPGENPEWQRGQVESGLKGARLNLPAFSAYSTVFGEQSQFMKELQGSLDINASKHWEYMKSLQTIQDKDSNIYKNITKGLKTVDVSKMRTFDLSTGVYGKKYMTDSAGNQVLNPRSFDDTVLDINKYSEAFKLAVPTGKYGPSGEIRKEEMYIPGALARGTYPEPLLAGERGMDQVTRRLSHFVNMAKELNDVMADPEQFLDAGEIRKKVPPVIGAWVKESWSLAKSKAPDAEEQLQGILNRMMPALSTTDAPSPSLINTAGRTEYQFAQDFYKGQMNKVAQGDKTRPEAMATTISTIGDLLIGKRKGTPEQMAAPTGLTRALDQGIGGVFAQSMGIDVVQDTIDKRVAALNKARIDYYNELANAATGKSGSVNELLFSRKIPAVMAKATTAVVDKRSDLSKFGKSLDEIQSKYGIELGHSSTDIEEISKTHAKAIKNYMKVGIPVLKETELGVPTTIAKKVPLDFIKKYKTFKDGGVAKQKPEEISGTLYDLLKYIEKLNVAKGDESGAVKGEVEKYIKEDLVPYVESIRYPFTGTSSIAPFKPKLLDEAAYQTEEGTSLSRNVLVAPGVPEGLGDLAPILENLQGKLKDEIANREALHKSGAPQEEIEKVTGFIRELSAAISDVIPKYTAQAQKLDFDGDQIEIHAAKTASARKDIESHFKRFHIRDASRDPQTADVFRTQFLSDATVASTGQYVLGESAAAFEKKFPAGKGFDFLQSPFLTQELEYMSSAQALNVLKDNPNVGDLSNVIQDILTTQNVPMEKIAEVVGTAKTASEGAPENAAQNIVEAINKQHAELMTVIEAGIKKRLYEEKFGDTIEAQLFKVHTGTETEGLYRVHRLAETAVGFGGGEIAGGAGKSSSYFQSRFPSGLKSMGGRPEEEFHTMLNEMVRFGIQKGMDVKHAGEKPVAGEMINYLTKGVEGASELWTRVQDENDKTFGDLRDFASANEASVRMRLGALSTSDIMSEAKSIVESRGEKMDVSGMDRDALTQLIVDKIGFKGFLEELSALIKREAIEGLISQAETWSPAKKADPGGGLQEVKGNLRDWATQQVQRQIERGGINIRQDITESQQPLYGMRTFFSSPGAEYQKYRGRFGDIPVPEESLEGMSEKEIKAYKFKYRKSAATASNIQQELRAFSSSKQGGAYADMIRGSVDSLYDKQAEVDKYVTMIVKEGYDTEAFKNVDIAERTLSRKGVSNFANSILNMKTGMKEEVDRLSELSGVPGLSDSEMFFIRRDSSKRFGDIKEKELKDTGMSKEDINTSVKEYVDKMVEKAQALKQLDRVIDALVSKQFEGRVLQDLVPRSGQIDQYSTYDKGRSEAFDRAREQMKFERGGRTKLTDAGQMASGGHPPTGISGISSGPGGVVPVHIVGADPGVTINVKGLESLGFVDKPTTTFDSISEMDKDLRKFAEDTKELGDIIKKTKPSKEGGKFISYEEFYSPSKLSGGGFAYGGGAKEFTEEARQQEQVEKIARDMVSRTPLASSSQALADWGSAIHAKFENALKDNGNVEVEKYGEFVDEVGGMIGGFADLVEYDDAGKIKTVADIKTIGGGKLEKIQKAVESAGSSNFTDVVKQLDSDAARQLEDYFSQLNAYLKIFDESAQAEIRFYDREGRGEDIEDYTAVSFKFDPERFAKDMKALQSARDRVKTTGGKFLKTGVRNYTGEPEGASIEELNRAIDLAKAAYEREIGTGDIRSMASGIGAAKRGKGYEESVKGVKAQAERMARKGIYKNLTKEELDKYLVPEEPVYGEAPEDFLHNLKILHDQSKLYQKSKGLSMDTADTMPKQIKESLESVRDQGPDYQSFIDLTGKLKDMDRPDFTGLDMIKAWKLYRIEVGDWLLKRADDAYEEMQALEEAGDIREANQAYGTFQARVTKAQEFVRRSVGKRTDIYTDDKRFVYPGVAKRAGVYQSPDQIMKKIGEPLGDDPKLISQFKSIIEGIKKETGKTPPIESARAIFEDLSDMNQGLVGILSDSEKFKRLGPEILEAWDFDKLTARTTRLRTAIQQILRDNKEMNAEQRKNLENLVKYLKNIEGMYSHMSLGGEQQEYGQMGIVPVPKFETPANQKALYARNVQSIRGYFSRPEEAGGPEIGESFNYTEKIVGQSGEVIKNVVHHFKKYGEELSVAGQKTGQFSESQTDLIEKMQKTSASFSNAVRRVVMWGAASRLVYGGVSQLKSSLDELANIEVGIAGLRMVMSPLETDFAKMSKSATGLAKQYGVPVTDVLKSMKIFAQQGLKQGDVIDRTQTATLASNVTTLNAKDATEALTSAMKIFREEGTQSMRFLDAWSEVEAKHAITADDMANAIKKSAAAAKSAGVNFDQLNGMVAAVGAVTRQTGKEVGTSFRFIFRRLFSEEGPKALAKMDIPTIDASGELRPAFDILGDLAGKWDDLSSAQRMNVAQAIGGTRQYNSLLVLMDQWDEVLRGIRNSTNSKGSAERRNAEIMKTYAKQLERTKAAATEFKMEIGKIALPAFTTGTKALTLMFEALTAIPAPIKAASAALAAFFTLGAKGIDIFDSVGGGIDKGMSVFENLGNELSKQMKIAKYEVLGKSDLTTDTFGLKTLTPMATKTANELRKAGDPLTEQGSKMSDFHSSIGQMMFQFQKWGQSYNEMLGNMAVGTGAFAEKVGEGAQDVGSFLSFATGGAELGIKGIKSTLQGGAAKRGLSGAAVKDVLTTEGVLKGGTKLLTKAGLLATEIAGSATYITGQAIDSVGEQIGAGGHKVLKDFSTQNAGFIKSVAPLALTVTALVPALKSGAEYFSKMTSSAQDFEKSVAGARRKNESQLKSVRDLLQEYDSLDDKVKSIQQARDPEVKSRRQELGTYESPLTTLQQVQGRAIDLTNQIAESNQNLVVGYDNLGNAVLKTGKNFRSYLKDIENLESQASMATEMEVLSKYLDDLANGSETEKVKLAFKELAEAFPVIGDLAARNIKVSPAKQLEVAAGDLNKRLNLKQKYPLSTAADKDIERLQGVIGKARDAYRETFSDMSRVYGTILSRANLRGLTKDQIEDVVNSPELRQAYEMQINVDPRFKLVEGVEWEDVMGKELITALNPKVAGSLDVVSEFTKANLESANIKPRVGKSASGDIVTFHKEMADQYGIAGAQAIVKMKGVDDWVVEYFNKRTLQLEERPLEEVENIVDSIFPLQKVKEDLSYRMESLNTFVAGASAGLTGISKTDFKRDFSLGERFFGDVPTSTILQGNKGYSPITGYGEISGMKDFKKDIEEYFFEPMKELRSKTENFQKLQLEGLDGSKSTIAKGFYDEITKLLDVLKNNQVVLQFRAVFVDLMKEMANSQRVLKEEIAVIKKRASLNTVSSGLTRGMPYDLENVDIGIRDVKDVTPAQRLLTNDADYKKQATYLTLLNKKSQSDLEMIDKLQRALVQIEDISAISEGFGASLKPEELGEYIKQVIPEREEGPFFELNKTNKDIKTSTASTVDRLDKILENLGDPSAVERGLDNLLDRLDASGNDDPRNTVRALERVAGTRDAAEKRGDQQGVMSANKVLDVLTKQLVAQVGYKKGIELIDGNMTVFSKKFTSNEFQQRALSGVDSRVLLDRLKKYGVEKPGLLGTGYKGTKALSESDSFKNFEKAQQRTVTQTTFSSKNLARVAAVTAALSKIQQLGNKNIINKIDDQIGILDQQIKDDRSKGAGADELTGLMKKREALTLKRSEKQQEADFYGTVSAISATGFAATELAKSFGLTEKQIKSLGVGAAGTYTAMVLASKITGKQLPDSAKKFGEEIKRFGTKVAKGEKPGVLDARSLKNAGKDMTKEFAAKTKEVFGKEAKAIGQAAVKVDQEKIIKNLDSTLNQRAKTMKEYTELGPEYKAFADLKIKQGKERNALSKEIGGYNPASPKYKDLVKKQNAELAAHLKKLGRDDKRNVVSKYPKMLNTDPTGDYMREVFGSELEKTGEYLVRGLEKAEAPSKLKQLIVAYLAVGLADYTSNKMADKTAMAETEKIMKQQSEALADLIRQYPEATEKALADISKETGVPVKEVTDLIKVDKSMVQDTSKQQKAVEDMMRELIDTYSGSFNLDSEGRRFLANRMAHKQAGEAVRANLVETYRANRGQIDTFNMDRRYSMTNVLNEQLKGFSGDVELPISKEDMSTQQRVYAEAGDQFKKTIDTFAGGALQLEYMRSNLEVLKQEMRSTEDFMIETDDDDARKHAKIRHEELNSVLTKQIGVVDKFAGSLRKIGETTSVMYKFSESIYKLKNSLKDISIQENVENMPGVRAFDESIDKMLGGSHPLARVAISTEESRMGSRVGMDLQHMRSNRYDVLEAQLLDQLRTASPEESIKIQRQLSDLPEQRRRDLQVTEQKRQDEMLRRGLQPYREQLFDLERVKSSPFITEQQSNAIGALQQSLSESLSKAGEIITTEQARKEVESKKDVLTPETYKTEMSKINKLEENKIFSTYRGIRPWDKNQSQTMSNTIREALKSSMLQSSEGIKSEMISDPIVKEIQFSNRLLGPIKDALTQMPGTAMIDDNISKSSTKKGKIEEISKESNKGLRSSKINDNPSVLEDTLDKTVKAMSSSTPRKKEDGFLKDVGFNSITKSIRETAKYPFKSLTDNLDPVSLIKGRVKESEPLSLIGDWLKSVSPFERMRELDPFTKMRELDPFPKMMSAPKTISQFQFPDINGPGKGLPRGASYKQKNEIIEKILEERKRNGGLAVGGKVTGPGGPREDKVPAWLSPGEYVIRAHAASKLGPEVLDHLNKNGTIPELADGGFAWNRLFRTGAEGTDRFFEDLKSHRLGLARKNTGFGTQAAAAAIEIGGKVLTSPVQLLAAIEGASDYMANKGFRGLKKDVSNITSSVKETGVGNIARQVVSGLGDALKDEIVSGGTGITSGIIESLIPTGVASKVLKSKTGDIAEALIDAPSFNKISGIASPKKTKSIALDAQKQAKIQNRFNKYMAGKIEKNPALGKIDFVIPKDIKTQYEADRIKEVINVVDDYTKMAPGITDENLMRINMSGKVSKSAKAFGMENSERTIGLHIPAPWAARNIISAGKNPGKNVGNTILIDRDLLKKSKKFEKAGYSAPLTTKHELGHHLSSQLNYIRKGSKNIYDDFGIEDILDQESNIRRSMEDMATHGTWAPSTDAMINKEEAFAETFARSSKYDAPKMQINKILKSLRDPDNLKGAQASMMVGKVKSRRAIENAVSSDYKNKIINTEEYQKRMSLATALKFAEGGEVLKPTLWDSVVDQYKIAKDYWVGKKEEFNEKKEYLFNAGVKEDEALLREAASLGDLKSKTAAGMGSSYGNKNEYYKILNGASNYDDGGEVENTSFWQKIKNSTGYMKEYYAAKKEEFNEKKEYLFNAGVKEDETLLREAASLGDLKSKTAAGMGSSYGNKNEYYKILNGAGKYNNGGKVRSFVSYGKNDKIREVTDDEYKKLRSDFATSAQGIKTESEEEGNSWRDPLTLHVPISLTKHDRSFGYKAKDTKEFRDTYDEDKNRPLDHKWGVHSGEYFQDENLLYPSMGRGLVDLSTLPKDLGKHLSEDFMGIGPKYDTDMLRRGLFKKKEFVKEQQDIRNSISIARDLDNRKKARLYTGTDEEKKDSNFYVDKSRNLVGYGSDKVLYQSIKNLRNDEHLLTDQRFIPEKGRVDPTLIMYGPKDMPYNKFNFESFNTADLPGHVSKLKKEYDKTKRALEYKGLTEEQTDILNKRITHLTTSASKMMSETSDSLAVSPEYIRNSRYAKSLTAFANFQKRNDFLKQVMGSDTIHPTTAFTKSPEIFKEMVDKFSSNTLTDKDRKKYNKLFKRNEELGVTGYRGPNLSDRERTLEDFKNLKKGFVSKPSEGGNSLIQNASALGIFAGSVGNRSILDYKQAAKFIPEIEDYFASMNNLSAKVYHNGGVVSKTGKIFAEKGEVVIPKTFADGGQVGTADTTALASSVAVKVDASEMLSKLASIELKVEDKELRVEDKELKVEDKELKVEETTLTVDEASLPKLGVETNSLPKIEVDYSNLPTISVEQPNWQVPVAMPENSVEVKVDVSDAASQLGSSIKNALSTKVEVEVSGASGNAVGGEKFDQLSQTVQSLSDRVLVIKNEVDDKIKMIGQGNNQTIDIDRKVSLGVENGMASVKQEMTDLRTQVGDVGSRQRQYQSTIDARLDQMNYDIRSAQNVCGIGTGGGIYG